MKRIVVIGQNGQVTTYLQRVLSDYELVVAGRDTLDLSKPRELQVKLAELQPDIIINPAAYTAVDLAEEEVDAAYTINRDAVSEIARYCAKQNTPLIHFSTDYVFDGSADTPYLESDATGPTGVYGASKLAGEQAILSADAPAIILRTAWVYSNHGKNFYKTMLGLAESRNELSVVSDQVGAPTYARSIAEGCKQLVDIIIHQGGLLPEQRGIYHFTCAGQTSWAEFARSLFLENDITNVKVNPIPSSDYPTPAQRPAYSVLNGEKLADVFGIALPHWGTALAQCAAETKSQ
ncbi:dTDP-4-dehydrorhamnose reductase [Arenicella xantha]|uniref:dTDP-4-dehydrorhamnose reductase n=1 Tax=Arenicella xantha TaxID=644221 RepID=A0A395JPX1_9GAMM|nr:dTDP-4-dehydrorhamnose reductase [Arenicella xantha]RBP51618.1 dTDP-4-dehydrorhamnose reductase [Arenicella xantha]